MATGEQHPRQDPPAAEHPEDDPASEADSAAGTATDTATDTAAETAAGTATETATGTHAEPDAVGEAVAELEQAMTVPPDPAVAAFFDVDNTIMRGASIFYMARGLYRRKFLTGRDIAHFAWQQASFVLRGENLEHVADIEAKALSFVAGHHSAELRAIGEEIYDELMAGKIWPGPYALARIHMDAGQRVWLVTATPVEVAEVIAARLGLTGALGTVAEQVDGVYTGRLVGGIMHGQAKADAVRALAEREGLDLERCAAYSDSANDLPMLSVVGTPVAVNPDRKLREHARANGWRIRDYRTGMKAARYAVPAAAGTGLAVGAAMGGLAVWRRFARGA